jgi:hypothetical protein
MQAKGILSKSAFKTFSMRNKGHSTACVLDLSKACTVLGLPIEIQVSKVMDLPKVCTDWMPKVCIDWMPKVCTDCQRYVWIVRGMQSLIKPWSLRWRFIAVNLTIFYIGLLSVSWGRDWDTRTTTRFTFASKFEWFYLILIASQLYSNLSGELQEKTNGLLKYCVFQVASRVQDVSPAPP